MKLDIGCGNRKKEGYIGIDKVKFDCVDIVKDIQKGLPFLDNVIDEIYCSHCLEHIEDLIFVMNEFYRVLKKEGVLIIEVPVVYWVEGKNTIINSGDFSVESFYYWTKDYMNRADYGIYGYFAIMDRTVMKEEREGYYNVSYNMEIIMKPVKSRNIP